MDDTTPGILLTDPRPLPRDTRCPRCGAKADKRTEACGFGTVRQEICGVCGYEFPEAE